MKTIKQQNLYSSYEELFFFDRNKLVDLGKKNKFNYESAKPFPYIVFDEFLPELIAHRISEAFPDKSFQGYKQPDNEYQVNKLGRTQENYFNGLDSFLRHMLNEFNSLAFIDFLETLTGIEGLIPDPHFKGGALHQVLRGGKLAIHTDFNKDIYRKLDRRINVLIYFNQGWQEDYGGALEFWNQDMVKCIKKIYPIQNRCVVFNTTSDSYHGHPDPLLCPEGKSRNSIALYYYTNGRDDGAEAATNTTWFARGDESFSKEKVSGLKSPSLISRIFALSFSIVKRLKSFFRRFKR